MNRRLLVTLLALTLLMSALGCASGTTVTIPSWQDEVERYVTEQGGGDPTVLSDLTMPDDRRGFAFIGRPEPAQSSDVYAVLLAHRAIAGKPYFVYLAGQVEQQRVTNIQLAALNVDGRKYTWRVGGPNDAALARYRAYGETLWRQRFPDRSTSPPMYEGFPRNDDVFEIAITDDHIVAVERNSGATWDLWLSGKAHPVNPGVARLHGFDENSDFATVSELKNASARSTMLQTEHVASRQ